MSTEPAFDQLPPDVQAAWLRGERGKAIILLKQRLDDPNDQSFPAARAAFAQGNHAEGARLLREVLEKSVGPLDGNSLGGSSAGEPASICAGEQLGPGEVPRSQIPSAVWWALALVAIFGAVLYGKLAP